MAALPDTPCPTLALADRALEAGQERYHRAHLGMSQIGRPCSREIFYSFRWSSLNNFDAPTLKRFEDGHASETTMVARLKAASGIELHDTDENGNQFRFEDFGGHFSGSCDGAILGLVQAPKTWHIFEGKSSEKWADLDKAKRKVGEKGALAEWNATYYAQAVLYMDYAGLDRHYLVCVSPGVRKWTAVRTNADPVHAQVMRDKAEAIIFTDTAPPRIGGPDFWQCRFCDFKELCHEGKQAERNCRTCIHVTPERDGTWTCGARSMALDKETQRKGCERHLYLPSLVEGEQIDAGEDWIAYRKPDGSEWRDTGAQVAA